MTNTLNAKILKMLLLVPAFIFCFSTYAQAADVRVLIGTEAVNQQYAITGTYQAIDLFTGQAVAEFPSGCTITAKREGPTIYLLQDGQQTAASSVGFSVTPQTNEGRIRYNSLTYRGGFIAIKTNSGTGILPVNLINIENYLYGVIGYEIGFSVNEQALKAQAVASRSYALASVSPANRFYDIKNDTSSQVYKGTMGEAQEVIDAVDATAGEVIFYGGGSKPQVVMAYFSANAGGHTESVANVWNGATAANSFAAVSSPYDIYAKTFGEANGLSWPIRQYSWQVNYTAAELEKIAADHGKNIGTFIELRTSTTGDDGKPTASGRVTKLEIVGTGGSITASKDNIRTFMGGLRSTLFTVVANAGVYLKDNFGTLAKSDNLSELMAVGFGGEPAKINEGAADFYVIDSEGVSTRSKTANNEGVSLVGYGHGHGVGLSQWGARGMAAEGYNYREIIEYYYCSNSDFYLGKLED